MQISSVGISPFSACRLCALNESMTHPDLLYATRLDPPASKVHMWEPFISFEAQYKIITQKPVKTKQPISIIGRYSSN